MKICNCLLIAAAVLAATSFAQAQNTNALVSSSDTNTAPHVRPPPAAPGARPPGLAGILTEEQRASFQKINTDVREKLMALQPKIQAAQQEVFEAGLSPKFDENLVRQKAQAAGQLIADMLVIRAKATSEIQPPLTPEQIEQIKEMESAAANPHASFTPNVRPVPPTNQGQNSPPPKQ